MRDIKFSRQYPAYHAFAGTETNFIEKILSNPSIEAIPSECFESEFYNLKCRDFKPKKTTVRAGNRWKKGDWFQPKAWTGKPYRSKPVAFCIPLQVLEVEPYQIDARGIHHLSHQILGGKELTEISVLDGFEYLADFNAWFNLKRGETFKGQRITFAT